MGGSSAHGRAWGAYPARKQHGVPLLRLLVGLASALAVGCPAIIEYRPQAHVVEELGVQQASQRLIEVLSHSINPRVIDLDVTEDVVRYRFPLSYLMGNPSGATTLEKRIIFTQVSRIDIFDNHVVFVRGTDEGLLAQLVFANAQDARAFADLVLSFRAYYAHGGRGTH
jgi:hypothetical protein